MLYYLQHCEPPVIPVLQELAVDKRKTFLIDGKDTWFFDDIQYLDTVWKDYGKNKQTLAELWIGFFNFYVEKFSFKRSVIAIRQKNSLSKFQKSWLHYSMAIEDPFDLDHNLAGSVKGDMFNKILSYFIRARLHFGSPFYGLTKLSMKEYYFDCSRFTDDIVPNDSGKIGKIDSDKNGEQKSLTKDIDLRCFHCDQSGHHKRDCTFQVRLQSQNSNLRNQKSRDYQTNGQEMQITNETKIENLVQTKYKDISINKNANREDGSEKHLNRLYDKSFPVLFSVEQIDSGKNDFLRKQSSAQYALPQQPFNNVSTLSYNSYVVSNPPLNLPPPPLNFIKHQPQLINVLEWKNLFFSSPLYVETFQTYLPNSIILSANDSFLHMQQRPKVGRDKSFEKNKNDQSAAKKSADKKNILQSSDKKSDHPVVAKNDVDIRSGKRYAGNTKSVSNRHDANLGFSNTKSPTNQSNNKNDLSNRNTSINQYNARRDVSNKNGSQNNIKRRV